MDSAYSDVRCNMCKTIPMQNVTLRCDGGIISASVDASKFYICAPNYSVKVTSTRVDMRTISTKQLPGNLHIEHEFRFRLPEQAEQFKAECDAVNDQIRANKPSIELSDTLAIWNKRCGCWQNYQCRLTSDKKFSGEMANGTKKFEVTITANSYVDGDYNYKDYSHHGQLYVIKLYVNEDPMVMAFSTFEQLKTWMLAFFYATTV